MLRVYQRLKHSKITRRSSLILLALVFLTSALDIFEHITKFPVLGKYELGIEIFSNGAMMLVLGIILIDNLARMEEEHREATYQLALMRTLDTQLESFDNWQALTQFVVSFPRTFLPMIGAQLLMVNPASGGYDLVAWYGLDDYLEEFSVFMQPDSSNILCALHRGEHTTAIKDCNCNLLSVNAEGERLHCHCLVLPCTNAPNALLHIYLPAFVMLDETQESICASIATRMGAALDSAWAARQSLAKFDNMQIERQHITRDLHDYLGQDLAILRSKLEKLSNTKSEEVFYIQRELKRMQSIADEAYEVVRGTLVALKVSETSDLVEALEKYARSVGERSHLQVNFNCTGDRLSVTYDKRLQIISIFREILANIERHADATQVIVYLVFAQDGLMLKVLDNGHGFNPAQARKNGHYGLKIVEERARLLQGHVTIKSSPETGTNISVYLPVLPEKVSALQS